MGQTGPLSAFAGFGNLAGAITGFYELTGWPDRAPAGPFLAYTDYVAPRYSVAALLAALDWRRRTGCGQHLDLSQAEASIHFLAPAILDHTVNGVAPDARWATPTRSSSPTACTRCTGDDSWVAIACETDDQRAALGRRRRRARRRRHRRRGRRRGRSATSRTRCRRSACRSTACRTAPPAGPIRSSSHRGHYLTVDHPVHDTCIVEGPRVVLSRTPGRRAPGRPEHGRAQRRRAARAPRLRRRPRHRARHRRRPRLTTAADSDAARQHRADLVGQLAPGPRSAAGRRADGGRQVGGWPSALISAAPTMPASFSRAAGTTSVSTSMCGSHLSALRLAPPPTMTSSGDSSLTTTSR